MRLDNMKGLFFLTIVLILLSCNDEVLLDERILSDYLELNNSLELGDIVACAGGNENGLLGLASKPTDIIFYPIEDATDFRYFESEDVVNINDFSKYIEKNLTNESVFNGYLWKFNNEPFSGEKMGIVSYRTPGKIHICTPIRQKTNIKPTEVNPDLVEINENGVTPSFSWTDGVIDENAVYFHVISDIENNFISGTYTFEKTFTFYDLSNVIFNITDTTSTPSLKPDEDYRFTLMGVSADNWINLFVEKEFSTN